MIIMAVCFLFHILLISMENKKKIFYIYKHLIKYQQFNYFCRDIKYAFNENYIFMNAEYCYSPRYTISGVYFTYSRLYNFIHIYGPDAFINVVDYCIKTRHNLKICDNWVEDFIYYDGRIPLDFFTKEKYGR